MNKKIGLVGATLLFIGTSFAQPHQPPHLTRQGSAVQLIVKDKPFLALGGELHNSTTSGAAYMRPVWAQMKAKHLNTVLAPVFWELVEPDEGKFNFTLVDSMILGARKEGLHLGLLWFGAFKTTYSTYVPSWVKRDSNRFPRAVNSKGEPLPMLSVFSQANLQANAHAFRMLMQHIKEMDARHQTVILVQVENEVGMFNTPRDNSEVARNAFAGAVPAALLAHLSQSKGKLQPELDSAWKANGGRTSGSWEEVFGKSGGPESGSGHPDLAAEFFSAYHYAAYVGALAAAGKKAYALPMFVNAWPKSPGMMSAPGKYPSGGPVPHTLDIWRAAAPAIDFITPNVYAQKKGIYYLVEQYHRGGNPVFIPEISRGAEAANIALWIYGQHDALCVAPFGVDEVPAAEDPFTQTFAALEGVRHLVLAHRGKGSMAGVYVDSADKSQSLRLNGYTIQANLVVPRVFPGGGPVPKAPVMAGGIVFATGPNEFIAVGRDYELVFTPQDGEASRPFVDLEFMDEGRFVQGKWEMVRRLNGDEGTGGGPIGSFAPKNNKTGSLRFQKAADDSYSIVRVKFYRY